MYKDKTKRKRMLAARPGLEETIEAPPGQLISESELQRAASGVL
jgi:hypothetical protein